MCRGATLISLAGLAEAGFEAGVSADEREAGELGLSGVPAFVADRRLALSGVQPFESLRELVERAGATGLRVRQVTLTLTRECRRIALSIARVLEAGS